VSDHADFNIPLDAPLEIESDHTVVPSSQPTFLSKPMMVYNRLLGNSVKYEAEGWFIDWKRINIHPEVDFDDESEPGALVNGEPASVSRFGDRYLIRTRQGQSYWYNPAGGSLSAVLDWGVNGVPNGSVTLDQGTLQPDTFTPENLDITIRLVGGQVRVTAIATDTKEEANRDWIEVTKPGAIYTQDEPFSDTGPNKYVRLTTDKTLQIGDEDDPDNPETMNRVIFNKMLEATFTRDTVDAGSPEVMPAWEDRLEILDNSDVDAVRMDYIGKYHIQALLNFEEQLINVWFHGINESHNPRASIGIPSPPGSGNIVNRNVQLFKLMSPHHTASPYDGPPWIEFDGYIDFSFFVVGTPAKMTVVVIQTVTRVSEDECQHHFSAGVAAGGGWSRWFAHDSEFTNHQCVITYKRMQEDSGGSTSTTEGTEHIATGGGGSVEVEGGDPGAGGGASVNLDPLTPEEVEFQSTTETEEYELKWGFASADPDDYRVASFRIGGAVDGINITILNTMENDRYVPGLPIKFEVHAEFNRMVNTNINDFSFANVSPNRAELTIVRGGGIYPFRVRLEAYDVYRRQFRLVTEGDSIPPMIRRTIRVPNPMGGTFPITFNQPPGPLRLPEVVYSTSISGWQRGADHVMVTFALDRTFITGASPQGLNLTINGDDDVPLEYEIKVRFTEETALRVKTIDMMGPDQSFGVIFGEDEYRPRVRIIDLPNVAYNYDRFRNLNKDGIVDGDSHKAHWSPPIIYDIDNRRRGHTPKWEHYIEVKEIERRDEDTGLEMMTFDILERGSNPGPDYEPNVVETLTAPTSRAFQGIFIEYHQMPSRSTMTNAENAPPINPLPRSRCVSIWTKARKGRPQNYNFRFGNQPNIEGTNYAFDDGDEPRPSIHYYGSDSEDEQWIIDAYIAYRFLMFAKLQLLKVEESNGDLSGVSVTEIVSTTAGLMARLSNELRVVYTYGFWSTMEEKAWVITEVEDGSSDATQKLNMYQRVGTTVTITPTGVYGWGTGPMPPVPVIKPGLPQGGAGAWISEDLRTRKTITLKATIDPEYIIANSVWADNTERDCWVVDHETVIVLGYNDKVSMYKKLPHPHLAPPHYMPGIFTTYAWAKQAYGTNLDGVELFDFPLSLWGLDRRYGISDAIEALPYIWTLDFDANSLVLRYCEAPTTVVDLDITPNWITVVIKVEAMPHLEDVDLGDYQDSLLILPPRLSAEEIWNVSRLSATRVGDELWFGIAADKGIKQWVVRISGSSITSICNGFGFVGVDGTITGGQYPVKLVDPVLGLTGILQPLSNIRPIRDNDGNLTRATNFRDLKGMFYVNGAVYFLDPFESLCYSIDGRGRKQSFPAISDFVCLANYQDGDRYGTKNDHIRIKTFNLLCIYATLGTYSSAFTESVTTSWKTFNDLQGTDMPFASLVGTSKDINTSKFEFKLAAFGAALAAAATNALKAENPMTSLGESTVDFFLDYNDMMNEKADKLSTTSGDHSAFMMLTDFYSVGQGSHIWAGPGFVQSQLVKCASICSSGFAQMKWIAEGAGIDPKQFILIPGFMIGLANGVPSYFHPFGEPSIYGYTSGLIQSTFGKQLPYRKYGYSHRYINYPTKDIYTHVLRDIAINIEEVEEELGHNEWNRMIKYYKAISFDIFGTVSNRSSIIEGSLLAASKLSGARRNDASNTAVQFSSPFVYDYCVYPEADLFYSAVDQEIVYVSIQDTKVLDGPPSNVVIKNEDVYIGSPYAALEVVHRKHFDPELIRPRAITPTTLLLNTTGINCIHSDRIYHVCDAYSNRVIRGSGVVGVEEELNSIHTFRADDDFKVSSIFPPFAVFGKFSSVFGFAYDWPIEVHTPFYKSLKSEGETRNVYRYSIPVIHDRLAHLPSVMKTLAAYKLNVIDGVTSLTTDLRSTLDTARRPDSLDFPIYGQLYRWNPEYISSIINQMGVQDIRDLVATIGLIYLGATPDFAYFYSEAIRSFYQFAPATVKRLMNADRFWRVKEGAYDFVEQAVVFSPTTEQGDIIVRNRNGIFENQIYNPNETIGPYEMYSMAGGFVFQGNRRFQVNRYLIMDTWGPNGKEGDGNGIDDTRMMPDIIRNYNRWVKPLNIRKIRDFWRKRIYGWVLEVSHNGSYFMSASEAVKEKLSNAGLLVQSTEPWTPPMIPDPMHPPQIYHCQMEDVTRPDPDWVRPNIFVIRNVPNPDYIPPTILNPNWPIVPNPGWSPTVPRAITQDDIDAGLTQDRDGFIPNWITNPDWELILEPDPDTGLEVPINLDPMPLHPGPYTPSSDPPNWIRDPSRLPASQVWINPDDPDIQIPNYEPEFITDFTSPREMDNPDYIPPPPEVPQFIEELTDTGRLDMSARPPMITVQEEVCRWIANPEPAPIVPSPFARPPNVIDTDVLRTASLDLRAIANGPINGWFLEPWPLATSFLGVDDYTETKFEWLINFAFNDILDRIWGKKYISVYIASETMTVGGLVQSAVTRIRLHRRMFAREGQFGYYSYRFNGNIGLGDSERLYLWSDGPIFVRSIKQLALGKTKRRTSTFEEYNETKGMEEL
jgi:hypothetical protein